MFSIQILKEKKRDHKILSFLRNSPWNLKFSYKFTLYLLCISLESWKKSQEIKFYFEPFSNSVVSVDLRVSRKSAI